MDNELIAMVVAGAVTSGAAYWVANANRRRINSESRRYVAETERIGDERIRAALSDAHDAERRAHRWSAGFWRLWAWIQDHWSDHHHEDGIELPDRDEFLDATDPGV